MEREGSKSFPVGKGRDVGRLPVGREDFLQSVPVAKVNLQKQYIILIINYENPSLGLA